MRTFLLIAVVAATWALAVALPARGQQRPNSGDAHGPLSPAEAIDRMDVPAGFRVEVVASEPQIVNPVAMAFDERGRIWVTESLEYPRLSAGPGRDRIKVLEDTTGDGRVDKVTVFADGLNIPSGIAVGHGSVWVANAPDILLLTDTDGDDRADEQEILVSGFGRLDTHEVPNSLTWGPDGWLYGLNGVYNPSHVRYRGREFKFDCAMFRIHPVTRDFELFCEGTSNPWGIAWDHAGSAFVSACVIDHLWHLVESGYYERQTGTYPAYTWKIESIVKHQHQRTAYCGLHYYDSDVYPEEFRNLLYMGNIHGGCINVDRLEKRGATYFATAESDFLTANDIWFMPVAQKTGPDGSLYVLDWYDRQHCYEDSNREWIANVDRGRGRLYRIRYGDTPRANPFDLAAETGEQLIERLASGNGYFRATAQRLLQERSSAALQKKLASIVLDTEAAPRTRMHALFSLVGGGELPADLHRRLLVHDDADVRAWAVRAAGEMSPLDDDVRRQVARLRGDPAPVVRLQVAIAAGKIADLDPLPLLVDVVVHSPSDTLIPRVAWQNLLPLLDERYSEVVANLRQRHLRESPGLARLVRRLSEWMVSSSAADAETVAQLLEWLLEDEQRGLGVVHHFLGELADRLHANEISEERRAAIAARLTRLLTTIMGETSTSAALGAAQVMGSWQDEDGLRVVRARLTDYDPPADWLRSLRTLILNRDPQALAAAMNVLDSGTALTEDLRPAVLAELARSDSAEVATEVLARYASMSPPLQTRAVDLLASRAMWAQPLLERIVGGEINAMALNANQARKMVNLRDDGLRDTIEQYWGTVRAERDPTREALVWKMENFFWRTPGDPHRGVHVFENACAKCHKIYGRGEEVGPDITHNGRSNFEQLLDNVFDPSRVIGAPYRAQIVVTSDGRTLTGVLVENSAQRVLLKTEGGKQVAIAKTDIDLLEESPISLMPEGLEKQLEKQELADLIAFLALDRPPSDPAARLIDGAPPEITW